MIKISNKQRGNNVIDYLTHSSFVYEDSINTDYEINSSTSVLFLSLRFHCCKPEYIFKRINKLKPYKLSILLIYVDIPNFSTTLLELYGKISLTILLGFSNEECSRYLKGLDINERRSINIIRRREEGCSNFLLSFKKFNKSDVECILSKYESLKGFFRDFESTSRNIEGIGDVKILHLKKYYEMNFKNDEKSK